MSKVPGMLWFWIALVVQLVVGFFYLSSGLLAPLGAVVALWLVWIGLTIGLISLRRRGPLTLLVPVIAACVWFAVLWAGETFLGWTG